MTQADTMKRCDPVLPADPAGETQARLVALLQDMQALIGVRPANRPRKLGETAADLAEANFDNLPV